ncbi:MAG: hypothetical protein FJW94_10425 [Actinobacteria bacterium]|nr:hypothetical protein [Actinomycetota bacterium]
MTAGLGRALRRGFAGRRSAATQGRLDGGAPPVSSAMPASGLPPPRDAEESGRRLVDVLLLADTYPPPPRTPLTFPRLSSE